MPRLNPFALGRTKLTKVWDARIDGHVVALAWSVPCGLIAAASADGPIALIDAKTGVPRHQLLGHGFGTSSIAWSADGVRLASAGQDGKVRLWDSATGAQLKALDAGAKWVERVAWCPTANLLASAAGKKLRLWNVEGELLREYPDHPSTIADIQWQPNEPVLAAAGYGKLFLWDTLRKRAQGGLREGEAPAEPRPDGMLDAPNGSAGASPSRPDTTPLQEYTWPGSMLVLAWSPDAQHIAAGAQDSSVRFWRLSDGEDLQMSGYPTKVRELSWDASGRYLATGGGPVPCVWDFSGAGPAGTTPLQFEAHKDNVTCLAFQHHGSFLASAGEDGLVALWQPGKQLGALALAKHADPVAQLAWSADDRQLVVGTAAGDIVLYSV